MKILILLVVLALLIFWIALGLPAAGSSDVSQIKTGFVDVGTGGDFAGLKIKPAHD
jgi:hypothetical protein